MVLVVGATGLVGGAICQKLAARGEKVKALVRATSSKERVEALRSSGVELCTGDLKDAESIAAACRGTDAVISTASSTLSRQPGDSIESVDADGQLNLVNAARAANVGRFLFVSFRRPPGFSFPLADAKERVENAIKSLNFTIIQASWFMEVWLSPALGFDYGNASARIYGAGTNPISWVSFRDVAEMCALGLRHRAAERSTIEFGGPEPLSPLDVVGRFEKIIGRPFKLDRVPESALLGQFEGATDSLQKSFAALMLGYSRGDAMNMPPVVDTFGIKLTTVNDYAHGVLGKAAAM
ncbi:MAG TPA: SDR family oxidoreductase [Bryobacteraceae bacterium]|nr:SDR family oxidoreductase [Bryobacteraceae bacterium]